MALRCFRKEIVLTGFSAESQAPMVVVDETKLSPTVCAAVLQLAHETLHRFGGPSWGAALPGQTLARVRSEYVIDCRPLRLAWRCQFFAILGQLANAKRT